MRCWGDNGSGQLGDGTDEPSLLPRDTGMVGAQLVVASDAFACALDQAGAVWCWGANGEGQLGVDASSAALPGGAAGSAVPLRAAELETDVPPLGMFARGSTACTLHSLGQAWCWGSNRGWLGRRPTRLGVVAAHAPNVVFLIVGDDSLRWIDADGSVTRFDWTSGEVTGLPNLLGTPTRRIAGDCEIKDSGTLWCGGLWIEDVRLPQPTALQASSLDANGAGACVVEANGAVSCSGVAIAPTSDAGASASKSFRTVDVPAADVVSVGAEHACSIAEDGGIWCWGALAGLDAVGPRQIAACTGRPVGRYRGVETRLPSATDVVEAHVARRQKECTCAEAVCLDVPTRPSRRCIEALTDPYAEALGCLAANDWRAATAGCDTATTADDCAAPEGWLQCSGDSKRCPGTDRSLLPRQLCDGAEDCDDGADELNCDPAQSAFRCDAEDSVPRMALCDAATDCSNGADEVNCSR